MALALLTAGCTENAPQDTARHIAVVTSVAPIEGGTRGTPVVSQAGMTDLSLSCTYTGDFDWTEWDNIDLMFDQRMIKSGLAEGSPDYWTYDGDPERWETGPGTTANDRYTFFAYAPYGSAANGIEALYPGTANFMLGMPDGRPFVSYVVPFDYSDQPDLMIAARRENVRPTANPVALNMSHALTAVGFRVIGSGQKIASIAITGFCDRGLVELDGANLHWDLLRIDGSGSLLQTPLPEAPLTEDWYEAGLATNAAASNTGDVMADDGWLMMIPQQLGSDALARITFTDGTPEMTFMLYAQEWTPGHRVTYTIRVLDSAVSNPVGEVDVDGVIWAMTNVAAPGTFTDTPFVYDGADFYNFTDATANANQGVCPRGWRTPSQSEYQALYSAADNSLGWVDDYNGTGVNGWEFIVPNGSLFFAASGNGSTTQPRTGEIGYYWSSTAWTTYGSYIMNLEASGAYMGQGANTSLYSVRCVRA